MLGTPYNDHNNPSVAISPQFVRNKIDEIERVLQSQKSPALEYLNTQGKKVITYLYIVSDEERGRISDKNFQLQKMKVSKMQPGLSDPQLAKVLSGAMEKTKFVWVKLQSLLQTVSSRRDEYIVVDVNGQRVGDLLMPTVLSLRTANKNPEFFEPMNQFLNSFATKVSRAPQSAA